MKRLWGDLHKAKTLATVPVLLAAAAFSSQTMAAGAPVSALEDRVNQMEQELQSLRDELARNKAADEECCGDVQQLEQRVATLEQTPEQTHHDNMLFFRGGYTDLLENRAGNSFTDTHNSLGLGPTNTEDNGWYVGAGFDFVLTHDIWGLMPGTWVDAELGLEYKHFGTENAVTVVPLAECLLGGGAVAACAASARGDIDVTMLTVSAAPKLRFLEGSKIRPWLIPGGLDFHVISPPSDSATVLDIGVQFGAGVDYEVIEGVFVGIDGRYHLSADYTDSNSDLTPAQKAVLAGSGVNVDTDQSNDNWTVGGYIGIGF
jgi:opacity protein-like surface antigen